MPIQAVCDGCGHAEAVEEAHWLQLSRRGSLSLWGDSSEPVDPVLGKRGLMFHSYDCLRIWLMERAAVR